MYKNNGESKNCNNSRGIFLLSAADKMLARIMLSRLITLIFELVLTEIQCRFRKWGGTKDMIFTLRQIQKKCAEQNFDLFIVFVDLTKAFDIVPRELLWRVLSKFRVHNKFFQYN
ncbi:uncharacterized protein LOC143027369 [Oratosquilla oratoria]|uniref:uncharacterized protein LOC143027369 n=1 Tax=Oratosquilla oratoria TaxID=337810 RepID=UPI003F770964